MKSSLKHKIILTTCSLFFMISQGESQIMRKLTSKLGQKVWTESTDSVEKKQDKNVFNEAFSVEGGMDFSGLLGGNSDYEVPDQYSFDFQVTMKMAMEKGKPMNQVWKYNTKQGYFGMENSGMLIIYDLDSDMMITINPKDKSFQAISTKLMGSFGQASEVEETDRMPEMVKTNETKTILGYKATKYIMEDAQMKGEFWMAPDVPFDQSTMAKSISSYSNKSAPLPEKMQGFMMEMKSYDKKSKTTSKLEVVQLGKIDEVIDMSQYKNGMEY